MQASEYDDADSDERTRLAIRVSPSLKRRLMRMARLSRSGTLQGYIEEELTRALEDKEARLAPILAAFDLRPKDGPIAGE